MAFDQVFDTYALGSAEQQEHAQEVVDDRPFEADLSRGTVTFGEGELTVRAELIGTEAADPGSWLWSWANPSGFPDPVTGAARHARGYGEQHGLAELTTAELRLDGTPVGYRMTVATCGLAGGYAFYPATAAPGTMAYLLLDSPALAHAIQGSVRVDLDPLGRVANITGQLQAGPEPAKRGLFGRKKQQSP